MRFILAELNDDQLDKLADILADIAKAGVILAFLSPAGSRMLVPAIIDMSKGVIGGLVFTYLSLLMLEMKEVKGREF